MSRARAKLRGFQRNQRARRQRRGRALALLGLRVEVLGLRAQLLQTRAQVLAKLGKVLDGLDETIRQLGLAMLSCGNSKFQALGKKSAIGKTGESVVQGNKLLFVASSVQ